MKNYVSTPIAAAAAVLVSGAVANAQNISISNVGFIGDSANLSGSINGSPFSKTLHTGLLPLTTSAGQVLPVFCIDIFHSINLGVQNPPLAYTFGTISHDSSKGAPGTGGNALSAPVPGEIQALAHLGYLDYVNGTGNADIYAGMQGAIWEIEYNTNGNSLTVSSSSAVKALITADIAWAQAHPLSYSVSLYPGANGAAFGPGQAYAYGAPEPSTWAMMALGFAGLAFAGYRSRRVAISIV